MWIGSIYARNTTSLTPAPTCSKLQNLTRCVPQGLTYVQYASALRALRVRTCFLWEMRNLTRGLLCVGWDEVGEKSYEVAWSGIKALRYGVS